MILDLLFYRQMSSNPFNVIYFVMSILLKVHVSVCIFLQLKLIKLITYAIASIVDYYDAILMVVACVSVTSHYTVISAIF